MEEHTHENPRESAASPGRALAVALLSTALGAAPAWLGVEGVVAALAWLGACAAPVGALAGALGLRLWPWGLAVPGAWAIASVWLEPPSGTVLASPAWAAMVVGGLFAGGLAVGRLAAVRGAAVLALVALGLTVFPAVGGHGLLGGRPLGRVDPELGALALDLSPATLAVESAGVDWMRHRSVYDPVGSEWFSGARAPYRGALAGPTVLLVGCAFALVAGVRRRGATHHA